MAQHCLYNSWYVQLGACKSDFSIAIQTVTSILNFRLSSQRHSLSRALALLLVVFILYGTTVEAAHRHGRVLPSGSHATALVDASLARNPGVNQTGCYDCLICQLHQSFSASLVQFRQNTPPIHVTTRFSGPTSVGFRSQTSTPRTGRAPPVLSLL